MEWLHINDDYLDHLRSKEGRIPKTNYGTDKMKPFFGKLFEVDNMVYVTQVSSYKPRHDKMREDIDFVKLVGKSGPIAVVNINYMFPVPKSLAKSIEYSKIDDFVQFEDVGKRDKYIALLKQEMDIIKTKDIGDKAQKLYQLKKEKPNNRVAQRCLEFQQLEIECREYLRIKRREQQRSRGGFELE